MQKPNSAHETSATGENPPHGDPHPSGLESKEHDDTETCEPRDYRNYSEDETDRQLRAISEWLRIRLKEANLVDVAGIITGVAVVIVGILAACIYANQLGVMQGQLDQMSRQFPEIQKSATAAKSAADTADAEFKISARAWVTANLSNPGGVQDGRPIVTIVDFTNTGKSPAVKVRTCQVSKIVDARKRSLDINCPVKRISPGFQVVLANNATLRTANAVDGDTVPPLTSDGFLTPPLHDDLRKGKRVAITYGFVEYDDIFKIHHWTKFCYFLMIMPPAPGGMSETNNWSVCDVGNDIDPRYD
jgi:hypothetical protein